MSSTALITGASAGVGAAYAEQLARRGHDLILVARDRTRLEKTAARLTETTGRNVDVLSADLATVGGIQAVEQRLATDRSIDVLVNNAGGAQFRPVANADPDELERLVTLNVTSLTRISTAAARAFAARDRGTIINIASIMAVNIMPGSATYSATKSYVLAFSQGLAQEFDGTGVRVQVVLPGALRTTLWDGSGIELSDLPAEIVMPVEEAVRAALAGLDAGELVTVPSLRDVELWEAYDRARLAIIPQGSLSTPASRYDA
jgi:short-subunit dehydrogenase